MKIKHFIISKFNLKLNKLNLPNENWFNYRLDLFEKYCYNSIKKQIDKNFTWLVFFDKDNTDIDKIKKFDLFTPIFISNYKSDIDIVNKIRRLIIKMSKGSDFIISTRLDTDDCLNKDYIQIIKENFQEKEIILNPVYGYVYDINKKDLRIIYTDRINPFITLIEKNSDNLKTCIFTKHSMMSDYFDVKKLIHYKPLWMQIIHGSNISNKISGVRLTNINEYF